MTNIQYLNRFVTKQKRNAIHSNFHLAYRNQTVLLSLNSFGA